MESVTIKDDEGSRRITIYIEHLKCSVICVACSESILFYSEIDGCIEICNETGLSFLGGKILISGISDDVFNGYLESSLVNNLGAFTYLQSWSISICSRFNRAAQLIKSNPNLFWLVSEFVLKNKEYVNIDEVFGLKRRLLIEKTVGCYHKGTKRVLEKVELLNGSEYEISLLKACISDEEMVSFFRHWDSIPIQAIFLTLNNRELLGARFLRSLCSEDKRRVTDYKIGLNSFFSLMNDTKRLGELLGIKNAASYVERCESIKALRRLHDRWVINLNRAKEYLERDIMFPIPEISGNYRIKWRSSANALIKEGRVMEHCVATYIDKAFDSNSILFSMKFPERVTIEVSQNKQGYSLAEAKTYRNKEVSEQSMRLIRNWLERENLKILMNKAKKVIGL